MGIETVVHRTVLWALASLTIMAPVYLFWALWIPSHKIGTAMEMTLISFVLFVFYHLHQLYIQPRIDHLFRRRKYDYFQIFGQLIREIGGELSIERITERLLAAFRDTLYVRNAVVLVRAKDESNGGRLEEIAAHGYGEGALSREGPSALTEASALFQWLKRMPDALERAQIEMAPPSEEARRSARAFFDAQQIEVLIPLLMAIAKTAISIYSREEDEPREILRRTNGILHQHMLGEKFMSMLYMRWNSREQRLRYASAGHEHMIVYRRGEQTVEAIPSGGLVLGLTPDATDLLAAGELALNVGDKLVLYTDGVIEAMNAQGEMFELEKLVQMVKQYAAQDATTLMGSIKSELYAYMAGASQHDDITIVVIEAV